MLGVCSDYPRFALLTIRQGVVDCSKSSFDKLADSPPEHKWIDVIVGILAIQGRSSIRAHPHMFGWKRLRWHECPILFHQTDASNHESIINGGLFPGGPDKCNSRGRGQRRWCTFTSLADGHGYFPNCSMIEGAPAIPYKFRSYGNVYCISSYYVEVVMKIEIWRTEA